MAAVTPADIKAEPLAVWDCRDRRGLFREHLDEASAWAIRHLGQEVANRTWRIDFHHADAPFAVLHGYALDADGRCYTDPETGSAALVVGVQVLDELPPAHLMGR